MVFGPWIEAWTWMKSLKPDFRKMHRPSFNYITLHYMYLIFLTILGSILLYPIKNMAYIDALFFAAGSATQSGLNTINVNDIYLYQQIVLYLICMIANPIFINTFLVFVRLYWFEKRFQSVVLESQKLRRTRTWGSRRDMTQARQDGDPSLEEAGLAGKKITVMHPGPITMHEASSAMNEDEKPGADSIKSMQRKAGNNDNQGRDDSSESNEQDGDNSNSSGENSSSMLQPFRRDITFADELHPARHVRTTSSGDPAPPQISTAQNIAFLEKQRADKDKGTLYIPGPRDFDRGDVPQELQFGGSDSPVTPRTVAPRGRYMQRYDTDATKLGKTSTFDKAVSTARSTWGKRLQYTKTDRTDKTDGEDGDDDPMRSQGLRKRGRRNSFASFVATRDSSEGPLPYLSYQPTIGRNSTFINLTEEQREELGGIEYRSLKTLAVILVSYFVGFHLLGLLVLVPWMVRSGRWGPIAEADGFNRTWWGIFTSASAFNDLGFTLTPDSMISFEYAVLPLLLMSFLIIIGNTGFPCMLRFIIWILSLVVPRSSGVYEEIRFLLDHPRRCFTLLFPARATWWLFWVLVILNGTDLIFFIILDLKDPIITTLSPGIRVLNGWFQAASTRTAGFADVDLADLHPAILVSYLVMMYISVLPIAISVRRTNVYEEKSLGIYAGQDEDDDESPNQSYVGAHLRRQLSFDLWYVFLGLFIVAIVEGTRLQSGDPNFSLFAVLFEIVSAYGTVGLSLGYPTIDASLSTEFHVISKLVIVAMMLRGRHRGLPYALDKAILLPSEGNRTMQRKIEEEEELRRQRRRTGSWATRVTSQTGSAAAGGGNEREQERGDDEKAPEEDAALRSGPGPAAPGLRRLQTSESASVGGREEDEGKRAQAQKKAKGGLGRLLSQMLSAGPTVKKKLYEGYMGD